MEWTDLAELVGPVAPTLGRLIGGALPVPFGAAIGEAAGNAIAAAVGSAADPTSVSAAIKATPPDVLKAQLQDVESHVQAQYAALAAQAQAESSIGTAQVASVAATQQAELINGAWYQRWWRPAIMFLWAATMPFQAFELLYHLHMSDPTTLAALPSVMVALTTWNGPWAAVAGIYSWNRSQEKIAALNGH